MALRGKKPVDRPQRLKLLMSGPAGVGKTTAAIQMPNPYIIDTESGSVHYGDLIEESGGAVFESSTIDDVLVEVRALMTDKHPYKTLVIDPVTTLFNNAVDEGERAVGTEFGKHYAHANAKFKRLCNLLTAIDMNVVVTAHEKREYGEDMKVVGMTYDGYKKLDYIFDLWLQLSRTRGHEDRTATVHKTRLDAFPDASEFPWSYSELIKRFPRKQLESGVKSVSLATAEEVAKFNALYKRLTEDEIKATGINKAITKYGQPEDWRSDQIESAIKLIEDVQTS